MTTEELKFYWDKRATEPCDRTTKDYYLRRLEIQEIVRRITKLNATVLDIGCGDGATTAHLAEHFPEATILGIDFSPAMIAVAEETSGQYLPNLTFQVAQFLEWKAERQFDYVITNRMIINLPTLGDQIRAFQKIKMLLNPRGHYLGTENFIEPCEQFNALRKMVGLEPIPVRAHNLYLHHLDVQEQLPGATIQGFADSYYFATRLHYALLCKENGIEPDYRSPEHACASRLPNIHTDICPTKLIHYVNEAHGETRGPSLAETIKAQTLTPGLPDTPKTPAGT